MKIDSIVNGIVLDHISAGRSMDIYRYLHLDQLDCSVAIIKNVRSKKLGRKDVIKIDEVIDVAVDILGYVDPEITVSIIEAGRTVRKYHPGLPETIHGVLTCRNPRCITGVEPQLEQVFRLVDRTHHVYRCQYCDTAARE